MSQETPVEGGKEQGTPSRSLQDAIATGKAKGVSLVDDNTENDYEPATTALPEKGIFTLVGGYVDSEGNNHNEVELRAMSGHEEDLLGNRGIPMTQRMDSIMGNCIVRLGTITDRGEILRAVPRMPSGTRTQLMIFQRIAGHWKTERDRYEMEVRCPSRRTCGKIGTYAINLLDLETYEVEDPTKRTFTVQVPYSEDEFVWEMMTGVEDRIMQAVSEGGIDGESAALSYSILVRLREWNGTAIDLDARDFMTGGKKPKLKLSKRAKELLLRVKNMHTGDRDFMRGEFEDNEPGIETDIEVECEHCGLEYMSRLDVAQEAFFSAGNVTALEAEAHFLMEYLHQGYRDIMAMPVGRRKRLCDEHEHMLKWRKKKQEAKDREAGRGGRR